MKKIYTILLTMVVSLNSQAQGKIEQPSNHSLSLGIAANFDDYTENVNLSSLQLSYQYELYRRIALTASGGIFYNLDDANPNLLAHCSSGGYQTKKELHRNIGLIVSRIRFNWLNTKFVQIYTGAEAGIKLRNTTFIDFLFTTEVIHDRRWQQKTSAFAYQINAIGIRVGGKIGGILDLGWGDRGIVNFGISYRF